MNQVGSITKEKALDLSQGGASFGDISKIAGVSISAISHALKKFDSLPIQQIEAYKANRADILSAKQARIIKGMSPKKIKNAPLHQLSQAYSQLYQAERLERDKTTSNVAYKDIDQSLKRLFKEHERLAKELGYEPQEGDFGPCSDIQEGVIIDCEGNQEAVLSGQDAIDALLDQAVNLGHNQQASNINNQELDDNGLDSADYSDTDNSV